MRGDQRVPDWLYMIIVSALALYFLIGGIVWSVLIFSGRPAPDSFVTILATIAGGLVGVLAPAAPASKQKAEDKLENSSK